MRKVKIGFFCIKTKKVYEPGDDYKGKRTDLNHVLEPEKEKKRTSNILKPKKVNSKKNKSWLILMLFRWLVQNCI